MDSPDTPPRPAFYDGAHYESQRSVGYWIKMAYAELQRSLDARMHPLDLTGMQWGPLWLIGSGRTDTVAACAREAGIDAGAMTRMLDRLEAKGLLARERCTADRRVVRVSLTDRGQDIVKEIPHILADVLNSHLVGFTDDELQSLLSLLQRFVRNGDATKD